MQLLSVLNNTVQISYNPEEQPLKLGDMLEFVIQSNNGVIAQVFRVGFENGVYIACLRIFFTLKEGNWIKWLGNIPPKSSTIRKVEDQDILELFGQFGKNNINLGYMPQFGMNMQIGLQNLTNTFILFDNKDNKYKLLDGIKDEFIQKNVPFIIFDFNNEYTAKKAPRISAINDFKLPLNVETLTSIYEKNFQYSSAEMRILFEDVIAQVKNFFNQSEEMFIPFKIFKSVVDNEKPSIELSLLKNLLKKYQEQNLFADTRADFLRLKAVFKKHNAYIIDMSEVPDEWQKEYIHFVIKNLSKYFVLMEDCKIFKNNKDIEEIMGARKSVKFIMAVSYSSELLGEFINKAKNLVLCAPNRKINYFPNLTEYLNLLSFDDFIYQGEQTKYIPLMLQPKQTKENRIIKQIATVREIIKTPEEVIIKSAKQDDIEDIISEIEILHTQEDDIPLIQEADKFESISINDISDIEALESLEDFSAEDFADIEEEKEDDESFGEYEVVEIQDHLDEDIDQLFSQDLISDVDALMQGKALEKATTGATKNVELHEKIAEQKIKDTAQSQINDIEQTPYQPQPTPAIEKRQEEIPQEPTGESLEETSLDDSIEELTFDSIEELDELEDFDAELLEEELLQDIQTEEPEITHAEVEEVEFESEETPETIEEAEADLEIDLDYFEELGEDLIEESHEHVNEEIWEEVEEEPLEELFDDEIIEEPIEEDYSNEAIVEETLPEIEPEEELLSEDILTEELPIEEIPVEEGIIEETPTEHTSNTTEQTPKEIPESVADKIQEEPIQADATVEPKAVYEQTEPVPEYPVEPPKETSNETFKKGDMIKHEKFGQGTIKRVISHGAKKLYKIQFENAGIKLLDLDTIKVKKS